MQATPTPTAVDVFDSHGSEPSVIADVLGWSGISAGHWSVDAALAA